jgi:PTH1 family peptidyl-tRNA hydrolase
MKIVVGLGNPGSRYAGTRHNVGFQVIDRLAEGPQTGPFQERFHAEVAEWRDGPDRVLLVKPLTFMNLSGRCVRAVADYHQVPWEDVLVVCDDFNLPLGQLRLRSKGTHGGHNGLRDVQNHLGTTAYPRLRIGVGAPDAADAVDHVLSRFRAGERAAIDEAVGRAAEAAAVWVRSGIGQAMNQYNGWGETGKPKQEGN